MSPLTTIPMTASLPSHESERVRALQELAVLDTPQEPAYDALTRLAAHVCGTRAAHIVFVDADRLFCKSRFGDVAPESQRARSCAEQVIEHPLEVLMVGNVPAGSGPSAVTLVPCDSSHFGFYAGSALVTSSGHAVGVLAVTDLQVRTLDEGQLRLLTSLAQQATLLAESGQQRHKLAQHERLLEQTHDAVFQWRPDGVVQSWNPGAEALYGWTRDEAVGRDGLELLRTELPHGRREFESALRRQGCWEGRLMHRAKDGRQIIVDSRCILLSLGSAHHIVMQTDRDRTAQSRAENLLRESEEQHRLLLDSMNDGVFVGQDMRFVFANRSLANMLGYSWVEFIGLAFGEVIDSAYVDVWQRTYAGHLNDGVVPASRFEVELLTKQGSRLWVEVHARAIRFKGQQGVLGIVRDVSEYKRIAKELQSFNTLLAERVAERTAEAEHLVTRLRAMAAELAVTEERERRQLSMDLHDDLAQKCALVIFKLDDAIVLADSAGPVDRISNTMITIKQMVQEIDRGMRSLMFQLSPPILYQLGLMPAVEWLAEEMSRSYGYTARVEGDSENARLLDPTIRFVVFRAVRELMINAGKHARTDRLVIRFAWGADTLRIDVQDFGRGFDVGRLEADMNDVGFGLFNVRERLLHCGGRLNMQSHPGAGTLATVFVSLPALDSDPELEAFGLMTLNEPAQKPPRGFPEPVG